MGIKENSITLECPDHDFEEEVKDKLGYN